MKMFNKIVPIMVIASILFAGCNIMDTNVDSEPKLRVQMKVNSAGTFAKQLTANQEASTLEINEVKLYVDELELDGTRGTNDFEMEDTIVNLPLDGSPFNLAENEVPAGFYDEFELEVERPDDDDDFVSDDDFRGDNGWYSIVVKGLYNGVEFTYRSTKDFEIETDLNPPLEIGENESAEMVIEIDVNSWFMDSSGMYLDPSDQDNRSQIDGNIENSFEGYEDDDDDDKSEDSEKAWAKVEFTNEGVDSDANGYAEYEERSYRTEFKVEIEDLDEGTYELWVAGEMQGEIEVTMDDDGTEGEIEFRNPAESGKEDLDFDPLGKLITIEQSGTVFLSVEFPTELKYDSDDDDDHDDGDDDDDDDDDDEGDDD